MNKNINKNINKTMINDSDSIYSQSSEPIKANANGNIASAIDLDIDNYTDKDLEKFFGLKKGYLIDDIEIKEREMREKIIKGMRSEVSFDKNFAKKVINFLNETKEILIDRAKENTIIVGGGGNSFIIDRSQPSLTNFIQPINTMPGEYATGVLNNLRRSTTNMTMSMNILFRDTTGISIPSDCVFSMSYTLKNVVSMKLVSIELPEKIYLLSNILQNNVFYVNDTGTGQQALIIIPEGCYDQNTLPVAVTLALNTSLLSTNYSVVIDPVNGKTLIQNSFNNFEMTFVIPTLTNQNMAKTFGWILGYRLSIYKDSDNYLSESLYSGDALNYFYFVLNDYNLSYTSNLFAIFNNSYIDKNILAKIPYTNNNNNITNELTYFDQNISIISPIRQYFGPVDIKKMSVQLLNKFGDIVPLNLMDYSFTLQMELAYDI